MEPLGVDTAAAAVHHPGYDAVFDRWRMRPEREFEEFADRYADEARDIVLGPGGSGILRSDARE
jgi:hypothetical protein